MNMLEELARDLLPDGERPGRYRFLVMPRQRASLIYVFFDGGESPEFILRVDRGDRSSERLFKVLRRLREGGDELMAATVPETFGYVRRGALTAVAYDYVQGAPIRPGDADEKECFDRISSWVEHLASQSEAFDKDLLPSVLESSFLLGMPEIRERLRVQDFPLHLSHGDLTPSHVLLDGNGFVVYDWEFVGLRFPLFDWFYFLTFFHRDRHFPEYRTGTDPLPLWDEMFRRRSGLAAGVAESTKDLARRLNLPFDRLSDLLRLFMVSALERMYFLQPEKSELVSLAGKICEEETIFDFAFAAS